jgi:hypothetical protein
MVKHDQVVPDGARCNQTVYARAHRQPGSPGMAVQIRGLEKHVSVERRFHDGKG